MAGVMKSPFAVFASLVLMIVAPAPIAAQDTGSPGGEYAGDTCITYRREGDAAFRLVNGCDQPLSVAICADSQGGTSCARDLGWRTLNIGPRGELPDSYAPLQVLNIFACKAPAVVQMVKGGFASCDPTGTANLPLLLASALKNASSIITSSDYPRNALAEGTTRFEMVVNAAGEPQSCTVTVSAGDDALDKATCNAFMRRARFTPAKGADGLAVSGKYRGSVTWREP
jgi:TonB family protein